jgi:hypothetical protein
MTDQTSPQTPTDPEIEALFTSMYTRGVSESARVLGVAPSTIRSWRTRGSIPDRYLPAIVALDAGQEDTPPPPLDPIPAGHVARGVSTLVDKNGKVKIQWIKTREEDQRAEAIARAFDRADRTAPREGYVPCPTSPGEDDLLAVYPMGDPHVGMLAWKDETGASFDLAIAERLMVGAMRDLVLRGPRARRAVVVNLGDFFHADNVHNHTTNGGHTLDMDGRTDKVLDVGVRIFTAMIDAALEQHEHVHVISKVGNHDTFAAKMLARCVRAFYRHEPRVTVDCTPEQRSYFRFGRVLLVATHGDQQKPQALGPIVAMERPEDWGATRARYALIGHVHHERVHELPGLRVESFRTLAGRDAWHAAKGYGAGRDMHRIVMHREFGEISREIASADYLQSRGAA